MKNGIIIRVTCVSGHSSGEYWSIGRRFTRGGVLLWVGNDRERPRGCEASIAEADYELLKHESRELLKIEESPQRLQDLGTQRDLERVTGERDETQAEVKRLQRLLEERPTRAEIDELRELLSDAQAERNKAVTELEALRGELKASQAELGKIQSELRDARSSVESLQLGMATPKLPEPQGSNKRARNRR